MKHILLTFLCTIFFIALGISQQYENIGKPQIALLGMFHFGETSDLGAIKMPELHGERRQSDIRDLIEQLKTYRPTKVLLEYPLTRRDTLQKRYESYLQGNYTLGDSETYQVGFRLAKELGHNKVYAIDHKMDLPFDEIAEHLTKVNQMDKMQAMMTKVGQLMQEETAALDTMALSSYLLRLNSEDFDALANSLYLKDILEMGSEDNEVGAKISATWYHRNMIMLKNIADCVESSDERILVIVGASHRAVIKDYVMDRTDLVYTEITKYME